MFNRYVTTATKGAKQVVFKREAEQLSCAEMAEESTKLRRPFDDKDDDPSEGDISTDESDFAGPKFEYQELEASEPLRARMV